jgi:hypothetical protein
MESGPARFFTREQLTIQPEPALPDAAVRVEFPNLDATDQSLAQIQNDMTAANDLLIGVAEEFAGNIGGVQTTLDTELSAPEASVPQAIMDELDATQQAIDGAESSFLPDAYVEHPPWYTPPREDIPDEEDGRGIGGKDLGGNP